jgi:hypothetical protein
MGALLSSQVEERKRALKDFKSKFHPLTLLLKGLRRPFWLTSWRFQIPKSAFQKHFKVS